MRRAVPWVGLSLGLALLGVAFLGVPTPGQRADVPPEPAQPTESRSGDAPSPAASEADESVALVPDAAEPSTVASPHGRVATRSARASDVAGRSVPVSVVLDRVGLSAPVEPVGLRPDGTMELPPPSGAGWFRHGATHGDASGTAVIAGHVDSQDGPGAFLPLRQAAPGDTVTVDGSAGETIEYVISDVTRHRKGELPTEALFAATGRHRLVLITCGGAFDEAASAYTENLVVIAEPRS